MEMLAGQQGRIGFFRPFITDKNKPDNITRLIVTRYNLSLLESLEERKCDVLALVANRIHPDGIDFITGEIKKMMPVDFPSAAAVFRTVAAGIPDQSATAGGRRHKITPDLQGIITTARLRRDYRRASRRI